MTRKSVRIGGASGFWGDAALATPQLLAAGDLDVIVYDYLAEITMAILARVRAKDPEQGYVADFVTGAMAPNLTEIARQGVQVISNAGGVNPQACARLLRAEIARQDLRLRVAVVTGDDLMPCLGQIGATGPKDMFTGADFPPPETIASINSYLGAFPIAAALRGGADIVITGRCVDSAVTLGACIHAFGWTDTEFDKLAGGSLAGHILECGPQATGGNFTDWQDVADDLVNLGYPIAEISPDGSFQVSKPKGTGGQVSRGTVGEQMLYEIDDPQAYLLPDVSCDFSEVCIKDIGPDLVRVTGASGASPPDSYKTCLTWQNGFRGGHLFAFYGIDAERKAQVFADAAIGRARVVLQRLNSPEFTDVSVEILGAESQFGAMRNSGPSREVVAKIAVKHSDARGIDVFLKEATGLGLAAPPGLSGFAGARPRPTPVMALFSYLTPKSEVPIEITDNAGTHDFAAATGPWARTPVLRPALPAMPARSGRQVDVPLVQLAWGRSGDKGDTVNVGIIARRPEYLPFIWQGLDDARIRAVFGHFLTGAIERFLLPGTASLNIVLRGVLGGGGTSSLRNDPQGKGYAQLLLATSIPIDADLAPDTPKGEK